MIRRNSIQSTSPQPVSLRRRLLFGMPILLTGCVAPQDTVRTDPASPERVATLQVEGRIDVVQGGRTSAGRDDMALYRGDEILSFASSYAQMRSLNGNRIWLDYDTRVRVGSIFMFFGRVFASVSGVFEIDSEFVAASTEGTELTVTIGRGGANTYSVAVRTGAVRCTPRRGRWPAVRLTAGQRLRSQGGAAPTIGKLDSRESQSEFDWVPARRGSPDPQRRVPVPPSKPSTPILR